MGGAGGYAGKGQGNSAGRIAERVNPTGVLGPRGPPRKTNNGNGTMSDKNKEWAANRKRNLNPSGGSLSAFEVPDFDYTPEN